MLTDYDASIINLWMNYALTHLPVVRASLPLVLQIPNAASNTWHPS